MPDERKEELTNPRTKERILCAQCKSETNHEILSRFFASESQDIGDDQSVDGWDRHEIVKCQGCDTASFRHRSYFSENAYYGDGDGVECRLYPHREMGGRPILPFEATPLILDKLYAEIINAYNTDLLALCAGGVRAAIECICKDKNVLSGKVLNANGASETRRDLQGKIAGLAENGLITIEQSEGLHQHRFMGNEALHDIIIPIKSELSLAIDILEHAIKQIYDIPETTKQLAARRKQRRPKP